MPEISVIVPVYKAEAYISRCVESILKQTFTDFELILVDDGSPDNSGKICDQYAEKDKRIHVVHKKNGGVSSARNAGLNIASGKYIAFVDSDDYVLETYLDDLYEPEYDLCVIGYREVYEDGELKSINVFEETRKMNITKDDVCLLINRVYGCWSKLFIKEYIDVNNLHFDETCTMGEDTMFSMDYFCLCKSIIVKSKHSYNYVRYASQTLTTTRNVKYFDGYIRTELYIKNKLQEAFGIDSTKDISEKIINKTSLSFMRVSCDSISFKEKTDVYSYFYHSVYFKMCLNQFEKFFPDIHGLTKLIIKLRCPLLTSIYFYIASIK